MSWIFIYIYIYIYIFFFKFENVTKTKFWNKHEKYKKKVLPFRRSWVRCKSWQVCIGKVREIIVRLGWRNLGHPWKSIKSGGFKSWDHQTLKENVSHAFKPLKYSFWDNIILTETLIWCYLISLLHRVFSWISQFYFHTSRWFVVWKGQELAYNMRHLLQVLWSDLVIIFYHMSFVTTIFIPSAHLSCLPFYSRWVDSWSISVPWCFLSVINCWYLSSLLNLFSFVLYLVVQLANSLIEVTTIAWNTFSLNGRVKHLSRDFLFYFNK